LRQLIERGSETLRVAVSVLRQPAPGAASASTA